MDKSPLGSDSALEDSRGEVKVTFPYSGKTMVVKYLGGVYAEEYLNRRCTYEEAWERQNTAVSDNPLSQLR